VAIVDNLALESRVLRRFMLVTSCNVHGRLRPSIHFPRFDDRSVLTLYHSLTGIRAAKAVDSR